MNKLKSVIQHPEIVDDLLQELNKAARDVCSFEFGLPLYDENTSARFREIVYRWPGQSHVKITLPEFSGGNFDPILH